MARQSSPEREIVKPAERFPFRKLDQPFLFDSDERLLAETFLWLADLCHRLPSKQAEDCLLLITTCRNRWHTLNAMYTEALKWCQEGGKHKGLADALDVLRGIVSGTLSRQKAGRKAAGILGVAAEYLYEFQKKHDLYFNRFDKIHHGLAEYAESIQDPVSRDSFKTTFVQLGNGPTEDDRLAGPSLGQDDPVLERLLHWFCFARPFTSLLRTYLAVSLGAGKAGTKSCADYLDELHSVKPILESYGYETPEIPSVQTFDEGKAGLSQFMMFCDAWYKVVRLFLKEMLPGQPGSSRKFPLWRPGEVETVSIGGRSFKRSEMFVIIADMRNSVGDKYRSPELKVLVEDVITKLREEQHAVSQTEYDDCRIVGAESIDRFVKCCTRLWKALEIRRQPEGFAGLRMGCVYGEMLLDYQGVWREDILKAAPIDSSHNTIARAARLMGLDKARWEETQQARILKKCLRDLSTDESLIFVDSSAFQRMPEGARCKCKEIDILQFKGIGPAQCWAIPIPVLAEIDLAGE